jgi:hypothetical protein
MTRALELVDFAKSASRVERAVDFTDEVGKHSPSARSRAVSGDHAQLHEVVVVSL